MKVKTLKSLIAFIFIATLTITSCDNPQTIAWSYYYCAEDALKDVDLDKAKEYLDGLDTKSDSILAIKADSLQKIIENKQHK